MSLCCSVLQCVTHESDKSERVYVYERVCDIVRDIYVSRYIHRYTTVVSCSVLQCVAVCCSVLRHTYLDTHLEIPRMEWRGLIGNFNTPNRYFLYLQISVDLSGNLWQ